MNREKRNVWCQKRKCVPGEDMPPSKKPTTFFNNEMRVESPSTSPVNNEMRVESQSTSPVNNEMRVESQSTSPVGNEMRVESPFISLMDVDEEEDFEIVGIFRNAI